MQSVNYIKRLRMTQFNKKVIPNAIIAKKPKTFDPNSHRNSHLREGTKRKKIRVSTLNRT